jgi:nucleoside-diphosphate-sugar epimerase
MRTVLVFGASGAVGRYLLPQLPDAYYKVSPVSRDTRAGWLSGDLYDTNRDWPATDIVISLGPLDAFAAWLESQQCAPGRVIALSSMSAESKALSPDPAERELAERLRAAEARVFDCTTRRDIACTIFRPTLIYGAGSDRSLAPIARFARRWHLLPIPLAATGLRQPVHAADLADACAAVIDLPVTYAKIYPLGGGERLTFATLLRRLCRAQRGLILPIPMPLAMLRLSRISPGVLARLREPLVADNAAALRDFGYAPRGFMAADVLPDAVGAR